MVKNNKNRFTLDEFWKMFANTKQKFDHKNPVVVSVPATFSEDPEVEVEIIDTKTEGLKKVIARAYHDQTNLNGSTIKPEIFLEKSESIKNRPILANIVTNEDGTMDFGAHDFEIEFNDEGEMKINYQEKMVGIITDYHFEYDSEASVNRAVVEGFLYEEYSADAIRILADRGNVDCSVELFIKDFHFDDEVNSLYLDDYYVSGLTLLGAEHLPGMAGSSITSNFEDVPVKSREENDDESGPAPSTKAKEKEQAEPVALDTVSEPVAEIKSGPESEQPVEAETKEETVTEASQSEEPEQDAEFILLEELAKTNQEYEQLNWVLLNDSDFVFSFEGSYYMGSFEDGEISSIQKAAVVSQETFDTLMSSLSEKESEVTALKEKLAGYENAEENKLKDEALSDELYAEYLEEEEFEEVIAKKDSMSASEFAAGLALAYTQVKRKQSKNKPVNKKVFKLSNTKDKELTKKEKRYGKTFAQKLEKGKEK